jgi:hypothetical protein
MRSFSRGHFQKYEGQHGKNNGLNKADKYFHRQKWEWQEIWYEVEHNGQKYLSSKNVSK